MSRTRQPGTNPQLQTTTESRDPSTVRLTGTLRLRGDETPSTSEPSSARRIRWSEDVVDNEGMGKKSSKVCCIYHKARPVGESSSESDSSDSNSSDSESENEIDRRRLRANAHHSHRRGRRPAEGESSEQLPEQDQEACCEHQPTKHKRRKPSPNAYEKMPKPSKNTSRGT
ncbi:Type 1 phosphatases regulator ypi1 [Penicillium atrosanguineum]|uniref:Type 1 phosphatases regulator n=1 Tax=Penicillium atrosanguineum TaxID=1132637 RepID=A0A9W9U102_9EURO|nr:Type 1 phosphatases regulator ypi1 [Penicillium atrosanguineum]KAJ5138090.1 Type 1 phosphatases regulator ypi1 [Penicillium atrosanguineum]KAJ5307188.1 Type 1 phosphatases regulator ypi1 [Penicillium atrosanguineum]